MTEENVHGLFQQVAAEMLVWGFRVDSGAFEGGEQVVVVTIWEADGAPRRTIAIPVDHAEVLVGEIAKHVDLLRNPKPRRPRSRRIGSSHDSAT